MGDPGVRGLGRPLALVAAWVLGGSGTAAAETPESPFFADIPVVLTASRLYQPAQESPVAVSVIDRETIRASGMTEIHDLFRLVPGFQVADWPKGSPMVVNHGLGDAFPRRMLVLVDGRSVLDPVMNSVDWQDLAIRPEDIERIEVVRGPNQASYGANAFQGVINIITLRPGDETGASLVLARGGDGFEDNILRAGGVAGDWAWRLTASARQATNFSDKATQQDSRREVVHRSTLNGQLTYRPDARSALRLSVGWAGGEDEVGSSLIASEPYHPVRNLNRYAMLDWQRTGPDGSEWSLRASHASRNEREHLAVSAGGLASPIDYDVDSRRDALEFKHIAPLGEALHGVWGLGYQRDEVRSDHFFHGLGSVGGEEWHLFGNLAWHFAPGWLVNVGATMEDRYNTDLLFSPRIALNHSLSPRHTLRFAASHGYLAPNMQQSTGREVFTYRGDSVVLPGIGDLLGRIVDVNVWALTPPEPQAMASFELGYVGTFPEYGLQVDARLFEERHSDFIDVMSCALGGGIAGVSPCPFPPPPGYAPVLGPEKAFIPWNFGDMAVRGADIALDWRDPRWGRWRLAHALTRISAGPGTDDDSEDSAPTHSSSLLWSKDFPGRFQASLGYYRVGRMKWLGDGDWQPAYGRVDLRLARRLGREGSDNEVALVFRNAGDRHVEFRGGAGQTRGSTVGQQVFLLLRLTWP